MVGRLTGPDDQGPIPYLCRTATQGGSSLRPRFPETAQSPEPGIPALRPREAAGSNLVPGTVIGHAPTSDDGDGPTSSEPTLRHRRSSTLSKSVPHPPPRRIPSASLKSRAVDSYFCTLHPSMHRAELGALTVVMFMEQPVRGVWKICCVHQKGVQFIKRNKPL